MIEMNKLKEDSNYDTNNPNYKFNTNNDISNYNQDNLNNTNLNKEKDPQNRKDFVKTIETPLRDTYQKLNMKDNLIWKGFPLYERFWNMLFCNSKCTTNLKSKLSPIDDFIANPAVVDPNINFLNKILTLKILRTGNLEIESNTIHPFVRISIIDIQTLRYVQKTNFDSHCFTIRETNLKASHSKVYNGYEFKEGQLDYIPPFSTGPYDLRDKGEPFAEWMEEFVINEDASNIYKNSVVIFFELLDYDFTIDFKNKNYSKDFIVPIAWGYLKPVGYSQSYLGKLKIQLYRYKYNRPEQYSALRNKGVAYQRTPDVLFEFNYFKREMYQTYLEIELHLENRPEEKEIMNNPKFHTQWKYKCSVFHREGDDEFILDDHIQEHKKNDDGEIPDMAKLLKNKEILKRIRNTDEPCEIPNKLLTKFSSAKLGCLRLTFSPNGRYLAAACTNINSTTTIKIFNTIELELRYHFKGHQELIHNLEWTPNNRVLISASADYKVSLWNIPHFETSNSENLDYLDNERTFLLTSISHPSYVYATALINLEYTGVIENNAYRIVLSTACADGYFRIFLVDFSIEDNYANYYKYRKTSKLYEYNIAHDFIQKDFSRFGQGNIKEKIMKFSEKAKNSKSSSIV